MDENPEIVRGDEDPEASTSDVPLRIVGFDDTQPVFANDAYVSSDPMSLQLVFTRFLPPPVVTRRINKESRSRGLYQSMLLPV